MDAEDFKTLGECDFGTIWEVQSENKIVVNAYQAALYFSRDDFLHFAKMVEESVKGLTGKGFDAVKPPVFASQEEEPENKAPEVSQITDFRAFRKKSLGIVQEDEGNDSGDDDLG